MSLVNKDTYKIIFAGTPKFAEEILSKLLSEKYNITAVYTQPDRPAGRGKILTASDVKKTAALAGIPVHQPVSLRNLDEQKNLAYLEPDLLIVVAYGLILPKEVLSIPKDGCINIHASILPRWRGAAPIQRAIEAGDKESGITIMQMDEGLDTGDVLAESKCPISSSETSAKLYNKLSLLARELLIEKLPEIIEKKITATKQDNKAASYAKKINKAEANIQWNSNAEEIERKIRAFNPWPICYSKIENNIIKIYSAKILNEQSSMLPGTIVNDKDGIDVACSNKIIRITRLQLEGGKVLDVKDILNSNKPFLKKGKCFQS